ncbi:MAG: hypothetical protein LWY06_03100, partial [Firmicutes bacterium]|nr:hypothetical protein [Bacillota bacterium]
DYTQKIPETEKVLRNWLIRIPSDKAVNALFKDENTVVVLTRSLLKDYFAVVTSSDEKKWKTVEHFEPKLRLKLFPIFSPMDLSPDRSTLAFFTILQPEDNSKNTKLLLVCYDLEKDKIVNETALYIIDDYFDEKYHPTDMKWNPVNKDLILFFHKDRFHLIDIPHQKTEIIDTTKIECQEVKSFRWSPDGKQIGILDFSGKLFIYDLTLKKTEKIYHDPDCFDFFWVE